MFKSKPKICFQLVLKKKKKRKKKSIETFLFRFVFWHHLSSLPKCLDIFLCFRCYCLFRLFLYTYALKVAFFFSVFQTNTSKQRHKGSLKFMPCYTHCHYRSSEGSAVSLERLLGTYQVLAKLQKRASFLLTLIWFSNPLLFSCIVLIWFCLLLLFILSQLEYLLQQQGKGLVESHVSASMLHKMDHTAASGYHIQRNQASMYGRAKRLSFNLLWAMWLFKLLFFSASR